MEREGELGVIDQEDWEALYLFKSSSIGAHDAVHQEPGVVLLKLFVLGSGVIFVGGGHSGVLGLWS
jgi:hypothetical protein